PPLPAQAMRAARAVELGELLPGMRKGLPPSHVKERRMDSPQGSSLCPYRSAERGYAHAQGSPGARKRHAGKYGESTPSRHRGEARGGGCDGSTTSARAKQVQPRQLLAEHFPNARIIKYHSLAAPKSDKGGLAAPKSDEGGSNSHPSTVWPTGIPQIDHLLGG